MAAVALVSYLVHHQTKTGLLVPAHLTQHGATTRPRLFILGANVELVLHLLLQVRHLAALLLAAARRLGLAARLGPATGFVLGHACYTVSTAQHAPGFLRQPTLGLLGRRRVLFSSSLLELAAVRDNTSVCPCWSVALVRFLLRVRLGVRLSGRVGALVLRASVHTRRSRHRVGGRSLDSSI